MAVTEESRHRLYQRLEEILGQEQATTLMEHLPPIGWADVATKRDLDHLEERIDARIDALEARIGPRVDSLEARIDHVAEATSLRMDALASGLRVEFYRGQRMLALAVLAAMTAQTGVLVAVGGG